MLILNGKILSEFKVKIQRFSIKKIQSIFDIYSKKGNVLIFWVFLFIFLFFNSSSASLFGTSSGQIIRRLRPAFLLLLMARIVFVWPFVFAMVEYAQNFVPMFQPFAFLQQTSFNFEKMLIPVRGGHSPLAIRQPQCIFQIASTASGTAQNLQN